MYDRNIFTKGYAMYVIRNKNNEVMRIVGRQEEAIAVCSLREGWQQWRARISQKIKQLEKQL